MKKKKNLHTILYILAVLTWVGAVSIASQLIVGYTMIGIMGRERLAEPLPTAIFSALSYTLAMVLIVFVPPKLLMKWQARKKQGKKQLADTEDCRVISRNELGLKELPTWTDIGLAPVGYFAYLLLASGITLLFSVFPWFDVEQAQNLGFSTFVTGSDRVIAFLVLVVVAPIVEEVIFRGWLYAKIRKKTAAVTNNVVSMMITIFLVSLLFGIVHMQWNIGVDVFALSIVLCALREVTGTIYAGMLLHMLKNGIAFYLLYVIGF